MKDKDKRITKFYFPGYINDVDKEYIGMPEYNNTEQPPPFITATFKFRNESDFLHFKKKVQHHLYDGVRVFDGMQKKKIKQAWYPHVEKASKYIYIDGDEDES